MVLKILKLPMLQFKIMIYNKNQKIEMNFQNLIQKIHQNPQFLKDKKVKRVKNNKMGRINKQMQMINDLML
jgi:hypothetical protein